YEMTPEMLDLFWSWFEVPTSNENVIWVQQEAQ
ncbi:ATP-binding protein, partial [Vibrio splendidus]